MITEKLSENYAREFISRTETILSQYNEIVATKLESEHRESEFYDVSLFINCLYGLLMMPSKLNKSVLEKFVLQAWQSLKTRKSAKCKGFIVLTALRFCTWYKHISGTKQLVPDFFCVSAFWQAGRTAELLDFCFFSVYYLKLHLHIACSYLHILLQFICR